MKKNFTASIWKENDMFVAQCLELDVASQGHTENEALNNLKEALELHFEDPVATIKPVIKNIEANIGIS